MEIQQLKHFVAVAQHGCLVKAADAIPISQSGLSRSIASLEARLGVPIIDRKAKGVELTPFGEALLVRARHIVNEVSRSLDEVRALEKGYQGVVCVGITQNYATYVMPELLMQMQEDRPLIGFTVITGGFLDLVERVKAGTIDLAFGLLGHFESSPELVVERLKEHRSRVVTRGGHPLTRQAQVGVTDLSAARWANLAGEGFQRNFTNYFEQRGVPTPWQALKTDSISLISRFLRSTDALSVLPVDVVRDDIASGALALLDCEAPAEVTQLGLVYMAREFASPHIAELAARLRAIVTR